jgi:hypothetical protein
MPVLLLVRLVSKLQIPFIRGRLPYCASLLPLLISARPKCCI